MSATILIVEDHDAVRESLRDWLEAVFPQCHVVQAASGEEALAIVQDPPPSLVVMDIGLPGMDGLAVARALKGAPRTKHIPIIIATSHAMRDDEEKILAAGCEGYVTKPINTREFAKQVAGHIEGEPRQEERADGR